MNKIVRYNILLTTALLLFVSCLKDDYSSCPRPFQVTIRALDADTRDITALGYVEQVILFLFDHNETFLDAFELCIDHVTGRRPIDIKFPYYAVPEFVIFDAWANICERVNFTHPGDVGVRTDKSLKLNRVQITQALRSTRDVVIPPGDLFFGSLGRVEIERGGNEFGRPHVVDIDRRTAGMHIRAINLQAFNNNREGSYRFEVHGALDALCHAGKYTGDWVIKIPDTHFEENGHFVTSDVFRKFASEDILEREEDIVIDIFFNDELIYSVDRDADGNPFVPVMGRTLNVVISLPTETTASLNVQTMVTPWNVVWQYVEWQ